MIIAYTALLLSARSEFIDCFTSLEGKEIPRKANEEWLLEGPRVYIPHTNVEVLRILTLSSEFGLLVYFL